MQFPHIAVPFCATHGEPERLFTQFLTFSGQVSPQRLIDADCGRRTQRKHPLARATSCPERLECPAKVKLEPSQYNMVVDQY